MNKMPGVHYAVTSDGVELPIVDITHPAFAVSVSEPEQRTLIEQFMREQRMITQLPRPLRYSVLWLRFRGSLLGRGVQRAKGTFLTGMNTYLLKLGPDMLGRAYTKPMDRRIAAALPAFSMRMCLQDVARLLAEAATPALLARPGKPLHLINIAGGPAMDSLNALVLMRREHPRALAGRQIVMNVLDQDDAGPTFGERALAAFLVHGAPLHGLQVTFRHVVYNWSHVAGLNSVLAVARAAQAVVAGSSEGGLFEYGSDNEIVANLEALRRGIPGGLTLVGSVTRADEPIQLLHEVGSSATRPRGLAVFRQLAEKAGWNVVQVIERPFSDQVALTASSTP